jgi:hypothetical protein
MGIDMKKMQERLSSLKNRGNQKNNMWKPQEGEQTIRIVPTADGDPFRDYWFHYGVGNSPGFLSPKRNFGEEDPLDAFVRSMWKENTDESIKMAKDLGAKQRFFCPVIVRGEEAAGARVWGFSKTVYEDIIRLILNPEYGDITDVDTGIDLTITYGKKPGETYPRTKVTPKRRSSPLAPSAEQITGVLDGVPDLDALFERKSPEQVQIILDEFLMGEDGSEDFSRETVKYSSSDSSVDKAFKELLG